MKSVTALFVFLFVFAGLGLQSASAQRGKVVRASRVHTSIPLRDMRRVPPRKQKAPYAIPNKFHKFGGGRIDKDKANFTDRALQTANGGMLAASVGPNFDGTSDDDNAAVAGTRIVPPDTEGDVGPGHYVQWNNLVAEIFDKGGNSLTGPFPGNQFFQGIGGLCEGSNDGDPVVRYDALADRWVVSQFAVPGPSYAECIAVSAGPDPTGSYHQYEFSFGSDFPDYPKLGVWPDAYYMTTRNFAGGSSFTGVQAVAFERAAMLTGASAQMVVFDVPGGTANDGWLPADLDGAAPPVGTPGIFAGAPNTTGSNRIQLYEFNVDWANTGNSSFSALGTLPTDPFDSSVSSVPQKKPGENLDALSGFLMFPMQYRNFGTHQTLLLNHTVDVGRNRAGIRWYELRNAGGGWSIFQQGTYAPGSLHRWVGSIAMNGNGDIGLAYTASSKNANPSIRFTGQTVDQSGSGIMNVAEQVIVAGGGTQRNSFNRWGDYSSTSVDPSDDLTFWHTNEYYATSGSFDFKTRIAAFTVGSSTPPPPPGEAVSVHVQDVTTGTKGAGRGKKYGKATVTVVNDLGNPVSGYLVTGDFSGAITQTGVSGSTDSNGIATLLTSTSLKGKFSVNFCVSGVSGTLPYIPGDNAGSFACAAAPAKAGFTASLATASDLEVPQEFSLGQNYPNPFNPATEIQFNLTESSVVSLIVYDVMGREVRRLVDGPLGAGAHSVSFNANELPSGAYVYRLETPSGALTKMMLLLK